ncbi:MAG: hypothetical protein NTX53_12770 [candidate division WOR-3 bacterium]|nr:hypothetical protein [candidate division WOR-3 bacterium]
MPRERVKRGKQRAFDPHTGGSPVPEAVQDAVRLRILNHAQKHYAGKFTRIDVRFRGTLSPDPSPSIASPRVALDDGLQDPDGLRTEAAERNNVAKTTILHDCSIEGIRNTPVHLVRLRYFDENRWSLAFYTYSNERYELCVYPHGSWFGTVEQAFDVGAVYMTD